MKLKIGTCYKIFIALFLMYYYTPCKALSEVFKSLSGLEASLQTLRRQLEAMGKPVIQKPKTPEKAPDEPKPTTTTTTKPADKPVLAKGEVPDVLKGVTVTKEEINKMKEELEKELKKDTAKIEDVIKILQQVGSALSKDEAEDYLYKLAKHLYADTLIPIQMLIEKSGQSIDINKKFGNEEETILFAVIGTTNSLEKVKYLINRGADLSIKNKDGESPLLHAMEKKRVGYRVEEIDLLREETLAKARTIFEEVTTIQLLENAVNSGKADQVKNLIKQVQGIIPYNSLYNLMWSVAKRSDSKQDDLKKAEILLGSNNPKLDITVGRLVLEAIDSNGDDSYNILSLLIGNIEKEDLKELEKRENQPMSSYVYSSKTTKDKHKKELLFMIKENTNDMYPALKNTTDLVAQLEDRADKGTGADVNNLIAQLKGKIPSEVLYNLMLKSAERSSKQKDDLQKLEHLLKESGDPKAYILYVRGSLIFKAIDSGGDDSFNVLELLVGNVDIANLKQIESERGNLQSYLFASKTAADREKKKYLLMVKEKTNERYPDLKNTMNLIEQLRDKVIKGTDTDVRKLTHGALKGKIPQYLLYNLVIELTKRSSSQTEDLKKLSSLLAASENAKELVIWGDGKPVFEAIDSAGDNSVNVLDLLLRKVSKNDLFDRVRSSGERKPYGENPEYYTFNNEGKLPFGTEKRALIRKAMGYQ